MFLKAVSVAPGSAAALFGAGRASLARQQYREAAQYLERALSIEERASAVHYPLAMAYRALGDSGRAEAHLKRRGSTVPRVPDSLRPQAVDALKSPATYEAEGIRALRDADWTAAAAAFRQGLELQPDDAALRHRLGSALYAAGDVAGAAKEFEAVVRRSPKFVKAHVSLGVILHLSGRYPEAVTRFTAAIAADPNFPEGHLGLGEALRITGALDSSLPHYERAIALDPSLVEPWIGGARALIGLERQKAAIVWLTDARQVHPGRPELDELWARVQPP
jgi:tetratricopeptide (TPR) repeat protein